jgi:sulfate permease, SulP family
VNTLTRLLPRRSDYGGLASSWKVDLVAGLTVGVVALPLALAFGITTGMGATAGLVTAIVAGFVAAVLGGSSVQVSGPTGAMAVVLVPVVARYGVAAVPAVGILAGAIVIVAALLRLGRYVAFVPWPVIEGFTVGIATLIFLQQVPSALGVAKPKGENTAVVAARALARSFGHGNIAALVVVAITVATMVAVPRLHRALPSSLIAVGVTTLVAKLAHLDAARIGAIPSSLPAPALPHLSADTISGLLSAALAVAALAALESLLSAKVADGMADTTRSDPDRELFGQGAANVAAALFGGMPATGAIARTAVNVRAGARTRVAAIVHAVFLLGIVLFAGSVVAEIPLAALAGVLAVTAVRMVEVHNVRAVVLATRSDAIVFGLTALATVAFDLVFAIELGMAVAAILALRNVALSASITAEKVSEEIDVDAAAALRHDGILTYRLDGALFFGAAQRFLTELTAVTDVRVVVLRLPDLQVLDATGAQALGEIVSELEGRGITVLVKGPQPAHRRTLAAVGALDRLAHENHCFDALPAALAHAREHARRAPRAAPKPAA